MRSYSMHISTRVVKHVPLQGTASLGRTLLQPSSRRPADWEARDLLHRHRSGSNCYSPLVGKDHLSAALLRDGENLPRAGPGGKRTQRAGTVPDRSELSQEVLSSEDEREDELHPDEIFATRLPLLGRLGGAFSALRGRGCIVFRWPWMQSDP